MSIPSTPFTTLISVEQLLALQASGNPLKVFDCSFDLMQPEAADRLYAEVHIAGAVQAHLDRHLSAQSAADAVNGGRHPLPRREVFAEWLRDTGFDNTMQAVVYDRNGANYCGRLWWMLKWAGHEAVAVLDGGLQAWEAAGGAVESGTPATPEVGHFTLSVEKAALATTATVAASVGRPTQTLVDARATPRFRGEMEPLDPVAGHIPGALNRPFGSNLGPDGRFKAADELKAEFEALLAGRNPATVVHHCGSGVSAVPNLLAMEVAGLGRTALYAGSWSEWCNTPGLPCAQG
jgi:thiosulfate/3-mercaptopyruvate sulfurtransferase